MLSRQASFLPDLRVDPPKRTRIIAVILLAVAMGVVSLLLMPQGLAQQGVLVAAISLGVVACALEIRARVKMSARDIATDLLNGFIEKDSAPSFVTDEDGMVHARNSAAVTRFADTDSETLAGTLRSVFANPSAVLYRLQCRAKLDGSAREDVVTRRGHVRLAVHVMEDQGFLWRIEDMVERSSNARKSESLPIPMLTIGRSGAVLFMNEAARTLVGQRVKSLDRLFKSLPYTPGAVNPISTATGSVDVVLSEHKGSAGRGELYLLPLSDNGPVQPGAGFDILPVPMLKIAPGGEILSVNNEAGLLIGDVSADQAHLGDVMQGLGRPIADWLRDTLSGQAAHQSEFLRLMRKDKEIFVQVTLSPIIEEGETRLLAVLNDATELKTLEAQFVQSQKMQAIGQLAGGVAHDFNNLLTAISGHCDLLLLRHDQGDQDYGDLVQINQNANRAAALVSQLLAFSRKQKLRPEVMDLRDTLADLTHLLNRLVGEKVTLTLSHDPVLRSIRADKRQLEQVLMNLVVNARDAMPGGGEIRIETEVTTLRESLQRDRATVPPGDYVTVRVSDQGVGISPDKITKVFEPFYTTKRTGEGTGLGLSTAYGIIKQSGGFIFVDSVEDKGTTFSIYFPVYDELPDEPRAEIADKKQPVTKQGEGVVLLVEDEAPVRAFASRALRLRGYTVLEAESAEDALRVLEDPDLIVDVFVTDVIMPGMDGPSWVREALKQRPGVRVVFVSGYAEGAFGDSQSAVPNSVFLPKPFSLSQLTETVHDQLH